VDVFEITRRAGRTPFGAPPLAFWASSTKPRWNVRVKMLCGESSQVKSSQVKFTPKITAKRGEHGSNQIHSALMRVVTSACAKKGLELEERRVKKRLGFRV
jgi:hypothetical protein